MANNKVVYGGTTIMDITDTTAEAADVAAGKVFYGRDGVRATGSGNYMDKVTNPTANEVLVTDANGQAIGSGVLIGDVVQMTDLPGEATDSTLGLVKTNSSENVTLDSDGKLKVGGRIGQFEGTTGLFAPNDRDPRNVANYSFLVTDAKGMDLSNTRSLAVVSGLGMTCRSAAAGTTTYRIQNTYANRINAICCANGYASKDEATSQQQRIVPIVSITIGGSAYVPDSAANSSATADDIVIVTAETLNPDSSITNIRLFGKMDSYATLFAGNGISAGAGGGRNLLLGGGVTKSGGGNDNCLVGNGMYSSGNGNAGFGRYHIFRKNRGFFAGTGHDGTNGPTEGVSAVGQYSYIDANTLFAVGNGSSQTARSNAFEARADGIVLKSPNGTRYKIAVSNTGAITATAL